MLKTIKSALKSIALAGTIICGAIITPELHNHYLRWEVGENVVQVLNPELGGGGTGFAVKGKSDRDYIMTNRHVCEVKNSDDEVLIKHPKIKRKVLRSVIYMDKVHDLCLIDASGLGFNPIDIGSDLKKGDYMYVVGHPGLRQLTTSVGEFIGKEIIEMIYDVQTRAECPGKVYEIPELVQMLMGREFVCTREYEALSTTAVIYGGNSGSPVVNKWGNLIGVAFAGSTQQERDNYIVPLSYVKNVLNKF